LRSLGPDQPQNTAEFARLRPLRKMPVLLDGTRSVVESTSIIEYLQRDHPGPVPLIPDEPDAALEARFWDRFFDQYVQTPQQKIVFDALRDPAERDARGVANAPGWIGT
jgi:glutathione S-transferase